MACFVAPPTRTPAFVAPPARTLGTALALLLCSGLVARAAAGTCSSPYPVVSGDSLNALPTKCNCAGTAAWPELCRINWDAIQAGRAAHGDPTQCPATAPTTFDTVPPGCCASIWPGLQLDLPTDCTNGQVGVSPARKPGVLSPGRARVPSPGPAPVPSPGAAPVPSPGQPTKHKKKKKVGGGVIAGVVGAIIVVALVVLLVCCFFGRRIFQRWRAARRPPNARRPKLLAAAAKPHLERQVFISHTGQDENAKNFAASILKPMLEQAGVQVYMDFTDLHPGCHWPEQLVLAAANSAIFVAVLSRQYYQRFWCMLELDLALNAQRYAAAGSGKVARSNSQRLAAMAGGSALAASHTGSSKREVPQIVPVFYNPPEVVAPSPRGAAQDGRKESGALVRQYWDSEDTLRKLRRKDEQLQSEWTRWVDAKQWAANLLRVKEEFHGVRRVDNGAKDVDLRVARQVTEAVVRLMGQQGAARNGGAKAEDDTLLPM